MNSLVIYPFIFPRLFHCLRMTLLTVSMITTVSSLTQASNTGIFPNLTEPDTVVDTYLFHTNLDDNNRLMLEPLRYLDHNVDGTGIIDIKRIIDIIRSRDKLFKPTILVLEHSDYDRERVDTDVSQRCEPKQDQASDSDPTSIPSKSFPSLGMTIVAVPQCPTASSLTQASPTGTILLIESDTVVDHIFPYDWLRLDDVTHLYAVKSIVIVNSGGCGLGNGYCGLDQELEIYFLSAPKLSTLFLFPVVNSHATTLYHAHYLPCCHATRILREIYIKENKIQKDVKDIVANLDQDERKDVMAYMKKFKK